ARSGTYVLAGYYDLSTVSRVVQHEILLGTAFLIIPPIPEQVISKTFALGSLQKPCWDDLVSIHIFCRQRDYRAGQYIKFIVSHVISVLIVKRPPWDLQFLLLLPLLLP